MITRLDVENFKAFAAHSLKLAPLTLLAGLNGMGKSTVLQTLLLLRQSHQQHLLPDTGLALNGDLASIGTGRDALCEQLDSDEVSFTLDTHTGESATWSFSATPEADWLPLQNFDGDQSIYQLPLFGKAFHYLQAERVGPRVTYPVSDYRVTRLGELGNHGEYATHFLEVFGPQQVPSAMRHPMTITQENDQQPAPWTLFEQTEAWLSELSPGARLTKELLPRADQVQLRWAFSQAGYKSNEYRTTNVGFGLSYVLPVIVALLSATPEHLILIENPEAHLHPRGQRLLGELIARCAQTGAQVIVETHSDHLLNGILLAVVSELLPADHIQIHYVERKPGPDRAWHTVVHSPDVYPDGRLSDWPDGFFDEWEKALRLLLRARDGRQGNGT